MKSLVEGTLHVRHTPLIVGADDSERPLRIRKIVPQSSKHRSKTRFRAPLNGSLGHQG